MITKIVCWWYIHIKEIATIATLCALIELVLIILLMFQIVSEIKLLYDIEALLTAHGVEWALYTNPL